MRKFLFHISANILFAVNIYAQSDSTFYFLNKNSLTNNVLTNFTDSTFWGMFDGIDDKTLKNKFAFEVLNDLNRHSFKSNENPVGRRGSISTESVKLNAATQIRSQNRIPIFIMLYEYSRIKANALADNLLRTENGRYYDILPRVESPYENKTLFISAPLKEKIFSGNQTFYISQDFFISNLTGPISIEIDFNDGVGYRAVSFGQSITVNYPNNNVKNIKTKITYNGNQLFAKAASTEEYCQGGYRPVDEYMIINSTIPFLNPSPYPIQWGDGQAVDPNQVGLTQAKVYIAYGAGHTPGHLVKPLVFIEGIDFGYDLSFTDATGNTIRYGDLGWCEFWGESYDPQDPDNYLHGNPEFKNSPQFLNTMIAHGYDIMFVDFIDGADFIQRNAMIIVELLNTIKNRQLNGFYDSQPTVLIGASMGGQVGKYALSYMEKNNIKHCVRDYISFDSPHNGANIPISLQQWIDFFAHNGQGGGKDDAKLSLSKRINRPATRQLLVRHYDDGNAYTQQDRIDFQNTMNAIGYPKKLRKVAIASGSRFGASQLYLSPGQQILNTDWSPLSCLNVNFIQGDCYTTNNGLSFAGRAFKNGALICLTLSPIACAGCASTNLLFDHATIGQPTSVPLWDNAPGGNRNTAEFIASQYNDAVAQFGGVLGGSADPNPLGMPAIPRESFIPTISALDVKTSNLTVNIDAFLPNKSEPDPAKYPFDAYYASPFNQPHVQLEDANLLNNSNIAWTMREILFTEPTLPFVLDNTSFNNGAFNMARLENRLIGKCSIGSGGKLFVNADRPAEFGAFPKPLAGSTLEAQTCDCPNVVVEIQNGGEFILGEQSPNNKAVVLFHSGTTLIIRNGGKLILNDNSKLVIEPGANFIIEPGAEIQLKGVNALIDVQGINTNINIVVGPPVLITKTAAIVKGGTIQFAGGNLSLSGTLINENCVIKIGKQMNFKYSLGASLQLKENDAVLDIAGTLEVGNDATFTFTYPSSPSGYIIFSSSSASTTNIIAGSSAKINLAGVNDQDLILAGGYVIPQDHLLEFRISPGTVSGAKINLGCSYLFSNVRFNSGGVSVAGQLGSFGNCTFNTASAGGMLSLKAPYRIIMQNCTLNNGGLFTAGGRSVLINVNFNGGAGWQSQGLTFSSIWSQGGVSNCTGYSAVDLQQNASSLSLSLYNVNLTNNISGLFAESGNLAMKCCSITDNAEYGLDLWNNVSLNMSALLSTKGGYNTITRNGLTKFSYPNINLDQAGSISGIHQGFNNLSTGVTHSVQQYLKKVFSGTLISCTPQSVFSNRWFANTGMLNTGPNGGNQPVYNITCASTGAPVLLTDGSPQIATCGAFDPPTPPGCIKCPVVHSTGTFANMKLNDAVLMVSSRMSSDSVAMVDTIANDLEAVSLFKEILLLPIDSSITEARFWYDQSFRLMNVALGNAFASDRYSSAELGDAVQDALDIHDRLIIQSDPQNFKEQFNLRLSKALVYRLAGDRDAALQHLNFMNDCFMSEKDRKLLKRWVALTTAEKKIFDGVVPRALADSLLAAMLPPIERPKPSVINTSSINSTAHIGIGVQIGAGTTIDQNVVIANNVSIGTGVTIKQGVKIGEGTIIGNQTTIDQNSVVGSTVVIENNVIIKQGTTIGDRVEISNNVLIDQNTRVGAFVFIGPKTSLKQNAVIADGSSIATGVAFDQNVKLGGNIIVMDSVTHSNRMYL